MGYRVWFKIIEIAKKSVTRQWMSTDIHPSIQMYELRKLEFAATYVIKLQAINEHGGGLMSDTYSKGNSFQTFYDRILH